MTAAGAAAAGPPLRTVTLDRCLGCGSTDLRRLAMRYEWRGSFPAARCAACGLRFLRVQPTPEALAELYAAPYFESDYRCGRSAAAYSDESAFRAENAGLLDLFARHAAPGRLLEVGCAGGWLLKHASERGWSPRGVELSADAVAHSRALGLDVVHGDLLSAALPGDAFDLAYLGDVLEHVPDPRAVLAELARVLRPGRVLVLRGPITTHSLARTLALAVCDVLDRPIVLREPPYHLWEFTPAPLARLFECCGFEVIESRQSKIPPGRAHGSKSAVQRATMAVLDTVNLPLTRLLNACGDRIVIVACVRPR